jgi:hypothetical protein
LESQVQQIKFYGIEAYVGEVDGPRLCDLCLSSDFPFGYVLFSLEFVRLLVGFLVVGDHLFMETVVNVVEHALPEIRP